MSTSLTVLLGPQRFRPTLSATLQSIGVQGPVAVVTAGWQEREDEDAELIDHLRGDGVNLEIYRRYEDALERDPALSAALRERQERFQRLQRLYRVRLEYALAPARDLLGRTEDDEFLTEHRRAAIRSIRTLDRQHLTRLRALHREFEARHAPTRRPAVAAQRRAIAGMIQRSAALAIAGGNVAVLLSRLRLFDLPGLLEGQPVVAWSAGAMALCERVVLFHDSPPQGAGNAELFEAGLARCRGLLPLPSASQRLRLGDPARVTLMARRFSPATCVALDPGARVDWDGNSWQPGPGTRHLARNGTVTALRP